MKILIKKLCQHSTHPQNFKQENMVNNLLWSPIHKKIILKYE